MHEKDKKNARKRTIEHKEFKAIMIPEKRIILLAVIQSLR